MGSSKNIWPNSDSSGRLLLEEIAYLHSWWDVPWHIGGDFNVTWFLSERSGESSLTSAMEEFLELTLS